MDKISWVQTENGAQRLCVRGKAVENVAYITYLTENHRYEDFTRAGYNLFSVPVYFGYRMLNEKHQLPVFTPGVFDAPDGNFRWFDRDMERILQANPRALIFPRVNVSLPERWEREHPEELTYQGPILHPECRRPCLASDLWLEEVCAELKQFFDHVFSMPYAENIVGFQIAGGNTEEWFHYDCNGGFGKPFDEKFRQRYPHKKPDVEDEDYLRMSSEIIAERICQLAKIFKEMTGYRYAIGSFYGYTMEVSCPLQGHHALMKLLECRELDFICSPLSYSNTRKPGFDHPLMIPIDSVKRHGKLYFTENDSRTHLSRPIADMPNYVKPIWFGPDTQEQTVEVLKMHYAKSLLKGHSCWWFDMWGGWYDTEGYMAFMKRCHELARASEALPLDSVSQVAVFVDEKCFAIACDVPLRNACTGGTRQALASTGAPFDLYLAEDLAVLGEREYRAAVLLAPVETPLSRQLRRLCAEKKIPLLTVNQDTVADLPTTLKAFYEESGVRIYTTAPCIFHRNRSYLFLHGKEDTTVTLTLDEGQTLYEVFEEKEYPHTFPLAFGQSRLFEIQSI